MCSREDDPSERRDRETAMTDERRAYRDWLIMLSLDASPIILRYGSIGWLAEIHEPPYTLYGTPADDANGAVGALYVAREATIDAIDRAVPMTTPRRYPSLRELL